MNPNNDNINKGKPKKKYVTLRDGGYNFRTLAKIMSKNGYQMNHATARNQLILVIDALLIYICSKLKTELSPETIKKMVESQEIHDQLSNVIYLAHKALKKEEEEEKRESYNNEE